jgi:ABC-type multidrug transport system ATPase subunit
MLELRDVTLYVGSGENVRPLLADVSATFPRGHFAAVIGPSGCGKSTLLKTILGVAHGHEEGQIFWNGRNLVEEDFSPSEIGYVPQFSIAHEELTVRECVVYAAQLRIKGLTLDQEDEIVSRVLNEVGMAEFSDRVVRVISGGQKRRLALAMELASAPAMLLCDEVTSGLDPQSEDEIVRLLHELSRKDGRLIVSVTHSLRHLDLYDSVLVLSKGSLAYHGPPQHLAHYFRCDDPSELYAQLDAREPQEWSQSWIKHGSAFEVPVADEPPLPSLEPEVTEESADSESVTASKEEKSPDESLPSWFSQFLTLTGRRFKIFSRNRTQILLQLGLILGFPILVAIFAWNGLPAVKNQTMGLDANVLQQVEEKTAFLMEASKIGSLVSGIVMFQVILLTLMAANNSGREIAAERLVFEKEKLSGLRPLAYVGSKIAFLSLLIMAQSLWMGLFVHFVCGFPGDLPTQLAFLLMVNAAMTSICLAISSFMATAEQASLVSIYLVGFQLPLSGAVLALPAWVEKITQPFIAAYWSWSGVLQTLKGERYYDIVQTVIQTQLSPATLCFWVLSSHIIIGIFAAWLGCQRSRLE